MTFDELVEVAAKHGVVARNWRNRSSKVPRSVVRRMLKAAFDAIADRCMHGAVVRVPGFGTFYPRTRAARRVRNPATHELMDIPRMRDFSLRPSKAVKR